MLPYLEPAEDSSHSAVQAVPASVAFMDHDFELAGPISAVLSGQAAILVINQFQLSQPLMNLPLETLQKIRERGNEFWIHDSNTVTSLCTQHCFLPIHLFAFVTAVVYFFNEINTFYIHSIHPKYEFNVVFNSKTLEYFTLRRKTKQNAATSTLLHLPTSQLTSNFLSSSLATV